MTTPGPATVATLDAQQLAQTFQPVRGVDYAWVAEHAQSAYEEMRETGTYLDAKAEKLIAFTGSLASVVVALAGKMTGDAQPAWGLGVTVLPSLLAALGGLFLAVRALHPRQQFSLPSAGVALKFAEAFTDYGAAQATFAARINAVTEEQRRIVGEKGYRVRLAYRCLAVSLVLLLVPHVALTLGWVRFSPSGPRRTEWKQSWTTRKTYPTSHTTKGMRAVRPSPASSTKV